MVGRGGGPMKHPVITMRKHRSGVEIDGKKYRLILPEGCTGLLFCFESKKAARAYWGKDTKLLRFAVDKD